MPATLVEPWLVCEGGGGGSGGSGGSGGGGEVGVRMFGGRIGREETRGEREEKGGGCEEGREQGRGRGRVKYVSPSYK